MTDTTSQTTNGVGDFDLDKLEEMARTRLAVVDARLAQARAEREALNVEIKALVGEKGRAERMLRPRSRRAATVAPAAEAAPTPT